MNKITTIGNSTLEINRIGLDLESKRGDHFHSWYEEGTSPVGK